MEKPQQVERAEPQLAMPQLPPWPTSQPGPRITEPPAGQRRVPGRTDQVAEVGYDEVRGKSAARTE
ncbi:MAG: hypothetical protein ABI234_11465 [Ktedonobacteraceae bacterium]